MYVITTEAEAERARLKAAERAQRRDAIEARMRAEARQPIVHAHTEHSTATGVLGAVFAGSLVGAGFLFGLIPGISPLMGAS